LSAGDQLLTDEEGQAELNVAECWDGALYLFHTSTGLLGVPYCVQAEFESSNAICLHSGTLVAAGCAEVFRAVTGSALLTTGGTVYSVTSLPDQSDTTVVVVLTGTVTITPVNSVDTMMLGDATDLKPGEFYFTMPLDELTSVAGLEARVVHPVADLAPLAKELLIQEWMKDVGEKGQEQKVLPPAWPDELTPPKPTAAPRPPGSWNISMDGGQLAEAPVQEAVVRAVDWAKVQAELGVENAWVTVQIAGRAPASISELPYDPKLAEEQLNQAGYTWEEPVLILYPAEEDLLAKVAEWITVYLADIKIEAKPEGVASDDLDSQWKMAVGSNVQVMRLHP
jgi:hypothetical protein